MNGPTDSPTVSKADGPGSGDHVGVLMYSRPEYLETMVAAYKVRAVPINVNYRYVAEELVYLFDNAELGRWCSRRVSPPWWLRFETDSPNSTKL